MNYFKNVFGFHFSLRFQSLDQDLLTCLRVTFLYDTRLFGLDVDADYDWFRAGKLIYIFLKLFHGLLAELLVIREIVALRRCHQDFFKPINKFKTLIYGLVIVIVRSIGFFQQERPYLNFLSIYLNINEQRFIDKLLSFFVFYYWHKRDIVINNYRFPSILLIDF